MLLHGMLFCMYYLFFKLFILYYINNNFIFIRHRLRLKHIQITFLPCFTHQMNLFIGEIFKESDRFKQASAKAIKIALYFKSSINKYFIDQLQTLQKESYETYIQIAIGNDTRWNSHYECFRTLLKSKGALQVYIIFILLLKYLF